MHFLHRDCKTEMGNIFTQTNAISKQKKIEIPDTAKLPNCKADLKSHVRPIGYNVKFVRLEVVAIWLWFLLIQINKVKGSLPDIKTSGHLYRVLIGCRGFPLNATILKHTEMSIGYHLIELNLFDFLVYGFLFFLLFRRYWAFLAHSSFPNTIISNN